MRNFSTFIMFMIKLNSGREDSKIEKMVLTIRSRQSYCCFSVIVELSPLSLIKLPLLLSLISKLMMTCLDDRMVNTHKGRVGAENSQGNGNPHSPPSLAQAIA
jgi:hypothetical protein